MIQATVHLVATAVVQVGIDMKRIEELKAEAGLYTDTSGRWVNAGSIDKFAELIIKECHMLAVGNANWLPKDVSPATGMNDVFEKYFGVKE